MVQARTPQTQAHLPVDELLEEETWLAERAAPEASDDGARPGAALPGRWAS